MISNLYTLDKFASYISYGNLYMSKFLGEPNIYTRMTHSKLANSSLSTIIMLFKSQTYHIKSVQQGPGFILYLTRNIAEDLKVDIQNVNSWHNLRDYRSHD